MDKQLRRHLVFFYLLFTFIILATVWVSLYFIIDRISAQSVDVKLSQAKVSAYRIQSRIEELMESYDLRKLNSSRDSYRQLHEIMERMQLENPEIIYSMLQSNSGLVVIHSDRSREGLLLQDRLSNRALQSTNPLIQSGILDASGIAADGFDIAIPIFYGATRVGVLRLGISDALVQESLTEEIRSLLGRHSLVFFIILTALFILFVFVVNQLNRVRLLQRRVSANEKLAYIGSISSSLAHEIKNPLNAINLNIQLLREDLEDEQIDREEAMGTCEIISDEVRHLNGLLNEFLAYARMDQPRLRKESISRLLISVADLFQAQCHQRNIRLNIDRSARQDILAIDRNQMRQVLTNLVKNAIEAMPEDGGRITLFHSTDRFRRHLIEVVDSGKGLDSDRQKQIFDIFYSTKKDGTGLGLPIAKNIVEAHGGSLRFRSQPGRGARVTLILPETHDQIE